MQCILSTVCILLLEYCIHTTLEYAYTSVARISSTSSYCKPLMHNTRVRTLARVCILKTTTRSMHSTLVNSMHIHTSYIHTS